MSDRLRAEVACTEFYDGKCLVGWVDRECSGKRPWALALYLPDGVMGRFETADGAREALEKIHAARPRGWREVEPERRGSVLRYPQRRNRES
jgi:hypothetical protein